MPLNQNNEWDETRRLGQQQTTGMEQVAVAMHNIDQATEQNLSSARETEDTVQRLNELAQELAEAVEQYRL